MWKGISDMLILEDLMNVVISWNISIILKMTGKKHLPVGLMYLRSGKKIEQSQEVIGDLGI